MKPVVALVGRPNVGKSTLFNKITKSQEALVDNMPGVTRDRHYKDTVWNDVAFTLVDTGGYLSDDLDDFAGEIRFQVNQAIGSADAVVLVLDRKSGPSPFDMELVRMLRGVKKPVFYVVNKVDGPEQEQELYDFYQLGIDSLYAVSAAHGYGIPDFLDDLVEALPDREPSAVMDFINIAVAGRPNVGKSSLINRILGEKRLVVSDIAGTTRDAVDTVYQENDQAYLFIDTAGIRRKGKVRQKIEKFSVIKAIKGLERCHVALVVLDASEGVTEQDMTIAGYAHDRGCGCILLFNKWDLVEKDAETAKKLRQDLRYASRFMSYAPILTISSLTGRRVKKIFPLVGEIYKQYSTRVGTGQFNRILEEAVRANEPSLVKGRRIKFYYGTQVSTAPPTFVCFVNYPKEVHFSYLRYLTNQVRLATGLDKTPIRIYLRQRTGSLDHFNFGKKSPSKKRRSKKR